MQDKILKTSQKILMIGWIILLHMILYFLVNLINSKRPESDFFIYSLSIDKSLPYLSWTWTIYYFGDVYITIGAALIVWRLNSKEFKNAILVYTGMIFSGALIQVLFPAQAPWPEKIAPSHLFFHDLVKMKPFACFPSMHVALAVFPACLLFSITKNKLIRILSTTTAALISISTVTLKEHYIMDVLSGLVLALIFHAVWIALSKEKTVQLQET